jgi:putative transposase
MVRALKGRHTWKIRDTPLCRPFRADSHAGALYPGRWPGLDYFRLSGGQTYGADDRASPDHPHRRFSLDAKPFLNSRITHWAESFRNGNLMPQSLTKLLVHLIYSTKNREAVLLDDIRDELHRYMAGILKEWESPPILVNSVADHVHILYSHSKNHSISRIVEQVKTGSSKWLKTKGASFEGFHWQNGYGAFSVSQSSVAAVVKYIEGQQEHHRRRTFQEEYRDFLRRYEVPFDERYVWD